MSKKKSMSSLLKSLVITSEIKGEKIPCTTSLKIAEIFSKEHRNVLRDFDNLCKNEASTGLNFELSEYTDSTGRKLKMYLLDEECTSLLLMGFTGEEAIKWKRAYIKEFQRMRKAIWKGSRIIRQRGDEPAYLLRAFTDLAKSKMEEQGKTPLTRHYINYNEGLNELVFGEHGRNKKLRKDLTQDQWDTLCKCIVKGIVVTSEKGYLRKAPFKEEIISKLPQSETHKLKLDAM